MLYVYSLKQNFVYLSSILFLGLFITGCPSKTETDVSGGSSSSSSLSKSQLYGPRQQVWLSPDRTDQTAGNDTYLADRRISDMNAMDTEAKWGTGADDCDSIKVAVIDSAVEIRHEDLEDNISLGWDEVGYDTDPSPSAFNSLTTEQKYIDQRDVHGTHVAGIIGAVGNNSLGTSGVCQKAQLIAIKALDGRSGTVSDVVEAIIFADQLGAQVINASWGVSAYVQSLYDAIAARPHILFVVAAGNNGVNIDSSSYSPATFSRNLPNVITVGAADVTNTTIGFATFSNYGTQTVQIAAPGSLILSTTPESCPRGGGGCGKYAELSGTSMATPFVTGAVALLWADQSHLSAIQMKQYLLDNATIDENNLNNKIDGKKFLSF